MKISTLLSSTLAIVCCSTGYSATTLQNLPKEFSLPASNHSSTFTYGLEFVSLDAKEDVKPDSLFGIRLGYSKNFGAWDKGFWTGNFTLGSATGKEDSDDQDIEVTHTTLNLGIDANFAVTDNTYIFVGPKLGMVTVDADNKKNHEDWKENLFQMGIQAGVKFYFGESRHSLTIGISHMMYEGGEEESSTALYIGGNFAF